MSPLGYDPEEKVESGPAKPGSYDFSVTAAEETEFRSGNQGLKVTLDVFTGGDQPRNVYENFVYVPKALWKLEQFMIAIGLDFNSPPEEEELIGREGVAYFELGEANEAGRRYLQSGEFYSKGTKALGPDGTTEGGPGNMAPSTARAPRGSVDSKSTVDVLDDDDIPF